jgi:hypothetical protein
MLNNFYKEQLKAKINVIDFFFFVVIYKKYESRRVQLFSNKIFWKQ